MNYFFPCFFSFNRNAVNGSFTFNCKVTFKGLVAVRGGRKAYFLGNFFSLPCVCIVSINLTFESILLYVVLNRSFAEIFFLLTKWWPIKLESPIFVKTITCAFVDKKKFWMEKIKFTIEHRIFIYQRILSRLEWIV